MPTRKPAPGLDAAYALKTPDDNRKLYRAWAATYDEDFVQANGYRLAAVVAGAFVAAGGTGPVLDVGCGTGEVAANLPRDLVIDGIDISEEMLARAAEKRRYRTLIAADLTETLDLPASTYNGLVSAGTFTHGHVGPQVLEYLMSLLTPGAVCSLSGNSAYFDNAGFPDILGALENGGIISTPSLTEEPVYAAAGELVAGHDADTCFVIVFRRL